MRTAVTAVLLVVAVSIVSALMPVELFISDAFRPPPNKVLTPEGVKEVAGVSPWLYPWRAAVVLTVLLFAAIVATFFTKPNPRARWTLAMLSTATALMHYLTLIFTSSPPGYGVSIYPLVYTIKVGQATQYYLDIGQILIAYAVYNVYKSERSI
ncbi:MAG: hypothetical protein ABWK05_03365 [Pyrobaculum sp.]